MLVEILYPLQPEQEHDRPHQPEAADDPRAEPVGDRQPRHLLGVGDPDQRVALGRHRKGDAGAVEERDITVIEPKIRSGLQRAVARERLDPNPGNLAGGHNLRHCAGDEAAEVEESAAGKVGGPGAQGDNARRMGNKQWS